MSSKVGRLVPITMIKNLGQFMRSDTGDDQATPWGGRCVRQCVPGTPTFHRQAPNVSTIPF